MTRAGQLTPAQVKAGNYAGGHFTPEQGRVLYHMERVFRSTGGGIKAHGVYVALCRAEHLPEHVDTWNLAQCVRGLRLIEQASRAAGLHWFRDVRTQWEPLLSRLLASAPRRERIALAARLSAIPRGC